MASAKSRATLSIMEMREYAAFSVGTQRYIARSLDVAMQRPDVMALWARTPSDEASIAKQSEAYGDIHFIRDHISDDEALTTKVIFSRLTQMSLFDLSQGYLTSFASYRFLYERLLGALVRPWLPAAFLAAACLPHLSGQLRLTLLRSIQGSVAAASGWSSREPEFFPAWVDEVEE